MEGRVVEVVRVEGRDGEVTQGRKEAEDGDKDAVLEDRPRSAVNDKGVELGPRCVEAKKHRSLLKVHQAGWKLPRRPVGDLLVLSDQPDVLLQFPSRRESVVKARE